jgi:hypothetical protein
MADQVNGLDSTILSQSIIGHWTNKAARRDFLRRLGLGAAGAAVAGATSFSQTSAFAQKANMDVTILEFALNSNISRSIRARRSAMGFVPVCSDPVPAPSPEAP